MRYTLMHFVLELFIPVEFELANICARKFLSPGKMVISESVHT